MSNTPTTASSSSTNSYYPFKVVLLGEGSVGKTSLVCRFINNTFTEFHTATIQAAFCQKRINISNRRVELNVWDTAGQERYHSLGSLYYRDAHGVLLVFDITDFNSFMRLKKWVTELRSVLDNGIPLVVVANKSDLRARRVVSIDDIKSYTDSISPSKASIEITQEYINSLSSLLLAYDNPSKPNNTSTASSVLWIESSAKSGNGVENAFLALSYLMILNTNTSAASSEEVDLLHKSNRSLPGIKRKQSSRRNLVINLEEDNSHSINNLQLQQEQQQRMCCTLQ